MSSILSHDMQPRDPYAPETTNPSPSPLKSSASTSDLAATTRFRYKSALTHQDPGPPPGAYLAQFNFDGTPKVQRSPSAASISEQQAAGASQGPTSFYSGMSSEQPKPRPLGHFGAMVDTRVEEKQRMRQELAYYEQLQRSERELRRSRASSANLEPPSNYFPFGQAQPKARIAHDLIQRPPPVQSNEVRLELQVAMREQLKQKEDARRQEREQQLSHVESGLIPLPSSHRASARIKNRFSDGRWDGPPSNMNFGTGGGGAPNYDPATGLIRTSLPVSMVPQPLLSVHDPAVAAAQSQYRAMLDYQRMLATAHQQQQQMYTSHEPGLPFVAHPAAPMDPSARYPLNHTDVVKPEGGPFTLGSSGPGVQPTRRSRRASSSAAGADALRPPGFDLPVVYPNAYGMQQQPPPACFYLGLPNERKVQRRQRSQSELGPTTEHGKELARDPRHYGTDVTRYQEALIRDAQVVSPGAVYHQGQVAGRHYSGQQQPVQQRVEPQQPQQQAMQQQADGMAKPPTGTVQRSRRASRQSQYSVPRSRSMPDPS